MCGKRVKTKSQKVLGNNSYICRIYRGKTGREDFPASPPSPQSWIGLKKQSDYLNISKVVKYNRQIMNQLKCEHFLDFIFTSGILMDVSLWLTVNANTFTTCCTDCTARFKHAIGSYIEMCSSCEFQLISKSSLF